MSSGSRRGSGDLVEVLAAGAGIVCLAGSGGKKSTIYQIAARLTGRVAVTATVHIPPFRKRLAANTLVAPVNELADRVAGVSESRLVAYACPSDKRARLAGVEPGVVTQIHEQCGFDVTLVKADGARLKRIKAPGPSEPVIPLHCATLLYLVSVRAVGEPLDATVAHRPEQVARLTGGRIGERITIEHVARLLAHPDGGLKHAGRAGCVVPVINMVDTEEHQYTGRIIAARVLDWAPGIDRVVLTRMVSEEPVVEVVAR